MIRAGSFLSVRHATRGTMRVFAEVDFSPDVEHWPVAEARLERQGTQNAFVQGESLRIRRSQVEGWRILSMPSPVGHLSTRGGCS